VAFPMGTPTLSRRGGFRSAGRTRPTFDSHRAGVTVATVTQWATAIRSAPRACLDPNSTSHPRTNNQAQLSGRPPGEPSRSPSRIAPKFRAATPGCCFIQIQGGS
jgi:hypothetical protein